MNHLEQKALAYKVLMHPRAHEEIDILTQSGHIEDLLSALIELLKHKRFRNDPRSGIQTDVLDKKAANNLRYVLLLNPSLLSERANKLHAEFVKVFIGDYASLTEMPELPPHDSIYYGREVIDPDGIDNTNETLAYAFFRKKSGPTPFWERYASNIYSKARLDPYPEAISQADLDELVIATLYQHKPITDNAYQAIMSSKVAFSGEVSKKTFAEALIKATQDVRCVGFYAIALITRCTIPATENDDSAMDRIYKLFYGAGNSPIYARSGFALKSGPFADDPLSIEDMKAVPYLLGYLPDLYVTVGLNYDHMAKVVAKKLLNAGFVEAARLIKPESV